jgi:succinyl-diaminopimelate desuccinylase
LSELVDPLPLAQALIRCASVTPADAGAQDVLAAALERLGSA